MSKFPAHELTSLEIKGLRLSLALAIKKLQDPIMVLTVFMDALLREEVSPALEEMGKEAEAIEKLYRETKAD